VEMEADFPRRNEIDRRFLDGILLRIAVDFDDREPQLPQPCPDAKPHRCAIALIWDSKSVELRVSIVAAPPAGQDTSIGTSEINDRVLVLVPMHSYQTLGQSASPVDA
jgi:hypothetical protein